MRKVIHADHLNWVSMIQGPTSWANLYGTGLVVLGYKILYRYGRLLMDTS